MAYFKRSSRYRMLATILAVVLMLWHAVNVPAKVQAQSSSASLSSKLENAFLRDVTSDTTLGGPSRCSCTMGKPFIALVPASGMGGETIAEYPTVFWYMPEISREEDSPTPAVEFVLRDEKSQEVYSTTYVLVRSREGFVGSPGIMSLTAVTPTPLEIGREYRWQLTFRCDPTEVDHSGDENWEGRLKRVQPDPNLVIRVQQATPEERVALYADARLWYETVGTLLELRREYPNDKNLADAWKTLLNSVGLKTFFEEPLNYFKLPGTKML